MHRGDVIVMTCVNLLSPLLWLTNKLKLYIYKNGMLPTFIVTGLTLNVYMFCPDPSEQWNKVLPVQDIWMHICDKKPKTVL